MRALLIDPTDRSVKEVHIAGSEMEIRALVLPAGPDPMTIAPGNHENPAYIVTRDVLWTYVDDEDGFAEVGWYSLFLDYESWTLIRDDDGVCRSGFHGVGLVLGEMPDGLFADARIPVDVLRKAIEWGVRED